MSFGFFTHNIDLTGGVSPCTWIPPDPDVDIIAEAIYTDTSTTHSETNYYFGTLTSFGTAALCQASGRRMVTCPDVTIPTPVFTVHDNALPLDPYYLANGTTDYLQITSFQRFNNAWYCHMNGAWIGRTNPINDNAYVGYSSDGVSWTVQSWTYKDGNGVPRVGRGNLNGRYTQRGMIWEGDSGSQRLVSDGRWQASQDWAGAYPAGTNSNSLTVAAYSAWIGGSPQGANLYDWGAWKTNANSYALLPLASGGYYRAWKSASGSAWMTSHYLDYNLDVVNSSGGTVNWLNGNSGKNNMVVGEDTVLIFRDDSTTYVWDKSLSGTAEYPYVTLPSYYASGNVVQRNMWNGYHWMVSSFNTGTTELYTNYTVSEYPTALNAGPNVVLPSTHTGNATHRAMCNIQHVRDNIWIGFYRDTSFRTVIFRFTYGTYTGDCVWSGD